MISNLVFSMLVAAKLNDSIYHMVFPAEEKTLKKYELASVAVVHE